MKNTVMPAMCGTCPFRDEGLVCVRGLLQERSLTEASPICHSTGRTIGVGKRASRKALLCRGARNFQLQVFHAMGFLETATDEAWDAKCKELGLP